MHTFIDRLARLFALIGGAVLTALIVLTCLSIVGRALNGALHSDLIEGALPGLAATLLGWGIGPINGDFELVEAGMAFAIFAFLPLCHLHGAHASVDIFTGALPPRAQAVLRAVVEVVFAAVMVLIAWQLLAGTQSKFNSGQTTFLIEFPVWWAYALSLCAAGVAALVAVYVAVLRVWGAFTGRVLLRDGPEVEH